MEITFYDTREKIYVSPGDLLTKKDLTFIGSGGQGRAYLWKYQSFNRRFNFTLKVIPDDEEVIQKVRAIYWKYRSLESPPDILKHRSLPIGHGRASPSEFDFSSAQNVSLIVFNWVNGISLGEYLDNKPDITSRKRIAKMIIDLINFFEICGIVHGDLFPDNFLVDESGRIHLIDLEGGGLLSKNMTDWVWKPSVLGKTYDGFSKAPELKDIPTIYTQRWDGIILLFYILYSQLRSPFFFLKRIDKIALEEFSRSINTNALKWPPLGIENMKTEYLNENIIKNIDKYRNGFSRDERMVQLLFSTFIHGYYEPKKRPTFNQIKHRLGL